MFLFWYLSLSFLSYVPTFGNDARFVLPRHFHITRFLRNSLRWSLIFSRSTVMAFALWVNLSPSLLPAYFGPWPADGLRRTEVAFWPRTCALVCVECCITSPGLYCTNRNCGTLLSENSGNFVIILVPWNSIVTWLLWAASRYEGEYWISCCQLFSQQSHRSCCYR